MCLPCCAGVGINIQYLADTAIVAQENGIGVASGTVKTFFFFA
jgi:hypothetical protein